MAESMSLEDETFGQRSGQVLSAGQRSILGGASTVGRTVRAP